MRIPRRFAAALTGAALATLALTSVASADDPGSYRLFGEAEYVSPGNASARAVELTSDAAPGFGGIAFTIPAGRTFADLTELSTDFMLEANDLCVVGTPRFQIGVDINGDGARDANIFVYFGLESASAPCVPDTWQNTTDLLEVDHTLDTAQLPAGSPYDPYLVALSKYGAYTVTGVQIVVEGGYAHPDGEQTVQIDNTNVDGHIYTYEVPQPQTTDDCKDGGYEDLARDDGTTFDNQGQCIKYVMTGE